MSDMGDVSLSYERSEYPADYLRTTTNFNQLRARMRQLTLHLRRKYPGNENWNDTYKSRYGRLVRVGGYDRRVNDWSAFPRWEIEYEMNNREASYYISRVRYNHVYCTYNVQVTGLHHSTDWFSIPKVYTKTFKQVPQVHDIVTIVNYDHVTNFIPYDRDVERNLRVDQYKLYLHEDN